MGIQEVVDYVMETPHNTNRAVLESMLDEMGKGSSDFTTCKVRFTVVGGIGNPEVAIAGAEQIAFRPVVKYGVNPNLFVGDGYEIDAVMYKGNGVIVIKSTDYEIGSVEGDVDGRGDYAEYYGDCTINLVAK